MIRIEATRARAKRCSRGVGLLDGAKRKFDWSAAVFTDKTAPK
jgi:hypothetical protein